ncbi:restriction endonuclease subunit S [Lactobacillus sp. UMNPBX14]|uniref:restriction endonuclease subunit S n=1 Tax=unclassified Lactobacillus TaxID=2620435 RepID=UPI003516460C
MISFKFGIALLLFTFFVWEQRKLGTAIKIIKDKNKNQHSYRAFSISNIKGFIAQDEQFGKDNTYSKTDKSTNYIVKPGMFAYNPARINVGSIAYQNQIEPVLVSSLYEIFQTNSKIDDSFLMNWFKTSLFNRQIKRLEEGGVRQYFFIDKMKETEIKLPSISEQNQISKLLQLVNKNLDLQQRKLELLSLIKKTIIKHLFKLKNSDSLNLKFKTSCSQWNSKKLGEIAKFINGRAFKQSELLNKGKYPVLRVGNFYTNDKWFYSDLNLNKNKYADKGDLLYTWSATFGPHIWKGPKVIFHYHIWKIDFDPSTVNKTFLFYFLEADKENLLTNSNGSTMIHITKSNMENKIINLPQFSIQQNIGTFLSNLDYLINQVKIKSKQLIQLKRFLLQNMFI